MPKVLNDQKSESLTVDGFVLDSRDGRKGIIYNLKDGEEKIASGLATVHKTSDGTIIKMSMEGHSKPARMKVEIVQEDCSFEKYGAPAFPGQYRGYWWCKVLEAEWPES